MSEREFGVDELKKFVEEFLGRVGYKLKESRPIGFVKPDIHAIRKVNERDYEIVAVVKEALDGAVEGFRDLAAARSFLKDAPDYVLVLPPVSEHGLIEFLIEKEEWYFDIKRQEFMIWLVNPKRGTTDCIIGWPKDNDFKAYFSNPELAGFDSFIGQRASRKIVEEEF